MPSDTPATGATEASVRSGSSEYARTKACTVAISSAAEIPLPLISPTASTSRSSLSGMKS